MRGVERDHGRPGPGDLHPEEGVALIRERTRTEPVVALVLGSGLGDAVTEGDALRREQEFAFQALPGFPSPSVPGHAGRLVMGTLFGVPAAVFLGRVHFYEGVGIGATTLIPRLAAALGARSLILTNAAGGLDPSFSAGDLMLIRDHIGLFPADPLFGWRFRDGTPAFVDLSEVYDATLRAACHAAAVRAGVRLREGVYAARSGPSYETPAEIHALRAMGADAVGMSTVPEAVAATALGMHVLGVSCITNVVGGELSHEEVLASAREAGPRLARVLAELLPGLREAAGAA